MTHLVIQIFYSALELTGYFILWYMRRFNKTRNLPLSFKFISFESLIFAYANKTKESITSQKLGSRDFWQIANSVLNKGKSGILPLFNGLEVLSSASDKAKCFA